MMGPILYPGPPNVPGTESTVGYPYIWPAKVQHHGNPWRHRGGFGVPPTVPVSAYPVPTQGPGMGYGSTTPTPILNQGYQPGPGGQNPL